MHKSKIVSSDHCENPIGLFLNFQTNNMQVRVDKIFLKSENSTSLFGPTPMQL